MIDLVLLERRIDMAGNPVVLTCYRALGPEPDQVLCSQHVTPTPSDNPVLWSDLDYVLREADKALTYHARYTQRDPGDETDRG